MTALVWLRRDLRWEDNPALGAALHSKQPVKVLYLQTPRTWEKHAQSSRQTQHILYSLEQLREEFLKKGIASYIETVPTFEEVPAFLEEFVTKHSIKQIYWNEEYLVDELQRDKQVKERLSSLQCSVYTYHERYVFPPGSILNQSKKPFQVFTPFKKRWLSLLQEHPEQLALYGSNTLNAFPPLERFDVEHYHLSRNYPAQQGTSQISSSLAIGVHSVRQCIYKALDISAPHELTLKMDRPGIAAWINELIWRDFYGHIAYLFPHVCKYQAFKKPTDRLLWREDKSDFEKWKKGETGFPLVDAAMRCLAQTGWLHNRLRMLVAMFLSKQLFIDWRWGERYFMEQLVDGDFASNNGGWQWCASTGTDAVPYFRIFNPITQSERFDPKGEFIRQYCPELKDLPSPLIHMPYERSEQFKQLGYPPPMVNLKFARDRIISHFKRISSLQQQLS